MYIALLLLLCGICAGRLFARRVPEMALGRVIFAFVLILLFLLGAQIGANARLIAALPVMGWQACLLMLLAVAGSILVLRICILLLGRRGLTLTGKKPNA